MNRKFTKRPVFASKSGKILPDDFEEMIPEEDFYKLLHFGKDTVEEYYEQCDYIESTYGGDCGVQSVQQVSQSSYQVEVSVELEVDYSDGHSGFESGTVILSYDMNTHEVDLVDSSNIGASTSVTASSGLEYPREECDTDYIQLYYDGKKYTAMGEIVVGQGATLQEAVNDAIEDASNYDSSMYDDMTYVDKVDYTEADVDDLGVLEVFWHFAD